MSNKKGYELPSNFIVDILLIIIAAILILGIWKVFFAKADDATAEGLCMGFNAARYRMSFELLPDRTITFIPKTCRRIDKKIPGEGYSETKDGTMEEVSDLVAKCWWMWLEGRQKNMFDKNVFGDQKCFVCYSFEITKQGGTFTAEELDSYLSKNVYMVRKETRCDSMSDEQKAECKKENQKNGESCTFNGGACMDTCKGEYPYLYNLWNCPKDDCCVKQKNVVTYLDYVQSYVGQGKVIYPQGLTFEPQKETYAITFISPGPKCGPLCWAGGVIGGATVVGASLMLAGAPLVAAGGIVGGLGITQGLYTLLFLTQTPENDINYIMLSRYNDIKNTCSVEIGTSGE